MAERAERAQLGEEDWGEPYPIFPGTAQAVPLHVGSYAVFCLSSHSCSPRFSQTPPGRGTSQQLDTQTQSVPLLHTDKGLPVGGYQKSPVGNQNIVGEILIFPQVMFTFGSTSWAAPASLYQPLPEHFLLLLPSVSHP